MVNGRVSFSGMLLSLFSSVNPGAECKSAVSSDRCMKAPNLLALAKYHHQSEDGSASWALTDVAIEYNAQGLQRYVHKTLGYIMII